MTNQTNPTQSSEPVAWQPIATAPKDNNRLLYLAHFNPAGGLEQLDFDGIWQSDRESWEMPEVYYFWASANGIDDPTHWAYQDEPIPTVTTQSPLTAELKAELLESLQLGLRASYAECRFLQYPEHQLETEPEIVKIRAAIDKLNKLEG